jgi:hypothetical protein
MYAPMGAFPVNLARDSHFRKRFHHCASTRLNAQSVVVFVTFLSKVSHHISNSIRSICHQVAQMRKKRGLSQACQVMNANGGMGEKMSGSVEGNSSAAHLVRASSFYTSIMVITGPSESDNLDELK